MTQAGFAATLPIKETYVPASPKTAPLPPVAPSPARQPFEITQLGHTRIDDYHWMKDDNWQAVLRDPSLIRADIKAALVEENAYSAAMLEDTKALQEDIFAEMKGRIKEDDASVPSPERITVH